MVYCVVPEALYDQLYDKLVAFYSDDPNVTVIVDRRKSERRSPGDAPGGEQRETRDRRRRRVPGEIPAVESDPAA